MGGADLRTLPPRPPPRISVPVPPGFPVRIHTGSLVRILNPHPHFFSSLFLSSDGQSGALSGEQERNHKKATPVANFRRRLQNFRSGGLW